MMRRFLTIALFAALFVALSLVSALADTYPSRTVFIVVPYPAGGSTDVLARAVANELSNLWGQSVVVENVGGASGILGAQKVAKSTSDGHTLMFTIDATVVSNRFLFKTLPYDPDKSFIPITMLARARQLVVAHPSFPAKNMREIVEVARKTPVAYASSGPGTTTHLFYEALGRRENAKFVHVPYRGITQQMTAVMTGEVQVSLATAAAVGSNVSAGKMKLLAIGGEKRSSVFPDVETVGEAGYPYVDSVIWWAMYAPEGTSREIVDKIYRDVATIARKPEFVDRFMTNLGIDPVVSSPAEFAEQTKHELKASAEMVKTAGVEPQ